MNQGKSKVLVRLGGGTVEVAVASSGDVLYSQSIRVGAPNTVTLASDIVRDVIVMAVGVALQRTPPELAQEIAEEGIVLTGDAARIENVDALLRSATGLPV